MNQSRRAVQAVFVVSLAVLLAGGVLFVLGQAIALAAGQGGWLVFFDEVIKPPLCVAASICAVAGFLLSYRSRRAQDAGQKAGSR